MSGEHDSSAVLPGEPEDSGIEPATTEDGIDSVGTEPVPTDTSPAIGPIPKEPLHPDTARS